MGKGCFAQGSGTIEERQGCFSLVRHVWCSKRVLTKGVESSAWFGVLSPPKTGWHRDVSRRVSLQIKEAKVLDALAAKNGKTFSSWAREVLMTATMAGRRKR
jgi:hypothetical protein